MEKGDYVRTKDYGIHKITKFEVYDYIEYIVDDNDMFYTKIDKTNIIKSSPNIIDLIEVGDYVNGVMVTEIKDGKPFKEDYNDPYYSYYFDDIYSIITHEQFESMEYKVEEQE